jgi:hypothetical protein
MESRSALKQLGYGHKGRLRMVAPARSRWTAFSTFRAFPCGSALV